jgi:hypothetical protein
MKHLTKSILGYQGAYIDMRFKNVRQYIARVFHMPVHRIFKFCIFTEGINNS